MKLPGAIIASIMSVVAADAAADVVVWDNNATPQENFTILVENYCDSTDDEIDAFLDAALSAGFAESIEDLAETQLLEQNSPLRNEALFAILAKKMAAKNYPSAFRLEALAELALRNAPGTAAPDFEFILRADGKRHSFRSITAGVETLLIFYDPDCHNCAATIAAIALNKDVSRRIANGTLAVVAIYSGNDTSLWQARADKIPATWYDGTDGGAVFDSETYNIPETPTVYLIGSDGIIQDLQKWTGQQ